MKKSMKYICLFLMLLGMNVSAWGTTTTQVIFPAGTTSSYSSGDWGEHGAYIGGYPTTEATESMCISDGVGFDVKFYYAYDGGNSNGLQLKKSSSAYVEMTIASSNGITVEVTYSATSDFDIDLTGASTVTASSGNTTATINTNNTNATLKINGTDAVVYIKYIKITRKSTGTITIGHDDCTVGPNVVFSPTSISESVTPAEAESGGSFETTVSVTGINLEPEGNAYGYVYYSFENASPSSSWDDDWVFTVTASSSSYTYTYITDGTLSETLTIGYSFISTPSPGTYSADLYAWYWDEGYDEVEFKKVTVTLTVTDPCTSRSITMSNFSKDFGSADFVPTHTVSAGSGTKTWTSSNTDVATIVDGKVHIVASGTSTIGLTVAEADPYCEVSQSCTMTVNALVPTVTAFTGTSSSTTSITLTNAQVSNKGGAAISAYGYIYSTTASTAETLKLGETGVSTATVASADIAASTNFASKTVSGLTTGTTYYIRAYATNSAGTGYSAVQSVKTIEYTDYRFACGDLTLTPKLVTAGTPIFITSTANKTVRSQDSILIVGNGLTTSQALEFPDLPSKFTIKSRTGAALATNASGEINAVAYIYYTPGAGDTSDGLDKLTGITVSVGGAKPKTATLTQDIIGRHLPADFVIAVKRDGKWYALPDTMTGTWNPKPVEIAVDDIDNPTIAYTATTNVYNLYGQVSETIGGQAGYLYSNGHTIKLGMKNNATYANYPLFGSATGTSTIGKGGTATSVTNNIGKQYWWVLTQTNTSIENAQDAKYSIKSANNTAPLILKENAGNPQWGFFTTGSVGPIRLIPASASTVVFAAASVVAWGKDSAIIEVDARAVFADSVKAKLPGDVESGKIKLKERGTSVKGTGTRYNYIVGFGDGFDFSANEGKMLTLEFYDVLKNLVAVSNVTVPKIVASDITINKTNYTNKSDWNKEIHIMPGKTVTIDASAYDGSNVTIKELNIYPGATVTVTGGTLIPTTLVLRNGWSRIGVKQYDIARLHIASTGSVGSTTAYADWYIDYDQYYPIAVPWQVATANISYKNMTVDIDQGLIIRRYDGERHAKGGKDGDGNTNWKQYTWGDDMPANLIPGIGYAITARRPAGKAFSIIRMPLTIPSTAWTTSGEKGVVEEVHKDQVEVTAWVKDEGETPDHAKGWNFIANPYMCNYKGDITHSKGDEFNIAYVNIPDVNFKEFDQVEISDAKLKPGSGFLIQTEETGTLTFGTSNRKASAPSYRTATPKATKQKAYIILSGEEAEDKMGLIISERYTAEYEINADLEKLLSDGNTLRTFMRYGNLNMAYVAINEELAREWIPVTVRIPAAGEYTFSLHEASKISELEGIYLIDYESNTVTNLIEDNYSFVAAGGTIADRFAINAIVGKHNTPTDIDIINAGGDINSKKPVKFIWDDKVFILHNGVIYDSTGKRVREINK